MLQIPKHFPKLFLREFFSQKKSWENCFCREKFSCSSDSNTKKHRVTGFFPRQHLKWTFSLVRRIFYWVAKKDEKFFFCCHTKKPWTDLPNKLDYWVSFSSQFSNKVFFSVQGKISKNTKNLVKTRTNTMKWNKKRIFVKNFCWQKKKLRT